MPTDVINRVHKLARQKDTAGTTFGWRDGTEIDHEDDDSLADPDCGPDLDDAVSEFDDANCSDDKDENDIPIAGVGNTNKNNENNDNADDNGHQQVNNNMLDGHAQQGRRA